MGCTTAVSTTGCFSVAMPPRKYTSVLIYFNRDISYFGPNVLNIAYVTAAVELRQTPLGDAVLANLPQLALSIAYLAYNGLFTRMISEREWALFSVRFQPLRVSRPKGLQESSYRLQIPLRWSIPLVVTSGVLHWLLSNCLYINTYISKPRSQLDVHDVLDPCLFNSSHHPRYLTRDCPRLASAAAIHAPSEKE
jgi:hypothetical protein